MSACCVSNADATGRLDICALRALRAGERSGGRAETRHADDLECHGKVFWTLSE